MVVHYENPKWVIGSVHGMGAICASCNPSAAGRVSQSAGGVQLRKSSAPVGEPAVEYEPYGGKSLPGDRQL